MLRIQFGEALAFVCLIYTVVVQPCSRVCPFASLAYVIIQLKLIKGCLLGGVHVPCIYRMLGGVIVGDSGLCCCVPEDVSLVEFMYLVFIVCKVELS